MAGGRHSGGANQCGRWRTPARSEPIGRWSASRHRLGVALLLDRPVDDAVDGLRRAVGDPSHIGRVAAHLTLVPPVNVRAGQLPAALAAVRAAAAGQPGPLQLTLGPPATFLPANPVLYLDVGGDLGCSLRRLRDAVFCSAPGAPPVLALGAPRDGRRHRQRGQDRRRRGGPGPVRGRDLASVECVTVLEEHRGRVWRPLADAALGPPAVIGRGGLAVEISAGSGPPDPEVHFMIEAAGVAAVPRGGVGEAGRGRVGGAWSRRAGPGLARSGAQSARRSSCRLVARAGWPAAGWPGGQMPVARWR